jgi:hypothetical protein
LYVPLKNISLPWRFIDLTDWLFIVLRPAQEFFTYMKAAFVAQWLERWAQ